MGNLTIYINGTRDLPGTLKSGNGYKHRPVSLVYRIRSGNGHGQSPLMRQLFNGLIDEVAIFNRALTADEIAAIYNAGSAGICAVKTIYLPLILKKLARALKFFLYLKNQLGGAYESKEKHLFSLGRRFLFLFACCRSNSWSACSSIPTRNGFLVEGGRKC